LDLERRDTGLIQTHISGGITSQAIAAVGIPFGTLLPLFLALVKAADVCYDRLSQIKRARILNRLFLDIFEKTSTTSKYLIKKNQMNSYEYWPEIYQLLRDKLVEFNPVENAWEVTTK